MTYYFSVSFIVHQHDTTKKGMKSDIVKKKLLFLVLDYKGKQKAWWPPKEKFQAGFMNNTSNPNQTLYEITQACVYYQEGPPKLTKIMSIYSFYELHS